MKQLPFEFCERMKSLLGDDYDKFIAALNGTPIKAYRVNTDKISLKDFEKINVFGNEKIPYVDNGFYLNYDKVGLHPYHHAGLIYVQEPAAMAPAECIDIKPDWKILDMCAAPGGKSTQIKNKLGANGVLVSNEIIPSRCKILTGNIERLGLENCVTTCMDTSRLASKFESTFDMIMVDAPCSGEGMFRKDDVAISEWSVQNVKMCAERQADILENAAKALKNGGYIVYATCTFSLDENEMVVDNFLSSHPEFELVSVKQSVADSTADGICFDGCKTENINLCRRFYPHISKGEGQFMAVLHNTEETVPYTKTNGGKTQKIPSLVFDFLDKTLTTYKKENITLYGDNVVYFTPDFYVPDGAFSCGVTIGEIKKNYIQPHHQFFMAMGKHFKNKVELSPTDEKIQKYLHGEEIEVDCQNGWGVVTVEGHALGGIKTVNGTAKNHYPKGLRM